MKSTLDRNELVQEHLALAQKLANKRYRTVNKSVQLGDLLSAAYLGLIDAAERFDPLKVNSQSKNPFDCYARRRILGEMNDYLRSCVWGTRNNPQAMGSIECVVSTHERSVLLKDLLENNELPIVDSLSKRDIIQKILRILPDKDRHIFVLRYVDDLTMREIGERVNMSESRISQIISYNLRLLKRYWAERKAELLTEIE